jgi:hypothetical protein
MSNSLLMAAYRVISRSIHCRDTVTTIELNFYFPEKAEFYYE